MKSGITLKELSELGMEQLTKKKPVTLEEARAQAERVKSRPDESNMEIVTGKLSVEWDILKVIFGEDEITIDTVSMGGKEFMIGEKINGVVFKNKFFICRNYNLKDGRKLFGYISKDSLFSEIIVITTMGEVSEKIVIKRNQVKNYHVKKKRK